MKIRMLGALVGALALGAAVASPLALAQAATKPAVTGPAAAAGGSRVAAQAVPAPASVPSQQVAPMTPELQAVRIMIEQRVPGMEVRSITKTDIAGLYEVLVDDRIVYVDPKVNYLIVGSIYDMASKTNLTDDRFRQLNRIAFDSLPFDQAFKRVHGDGSRKMAVFSDADCPFCMRIEKELVGLNNVTIYTFPFPIDSLHPDSARKSRQLWCAKGDRGANWDAWFASGKLPDNKGDCDNPIVANQQLGEKLHISATPTMIFADGSVVPGALPLAQIEQTLAKATADAKVAKQ